MKFRKANWEAWDGYSVANMPFGIQLPIVKGKDKWVWLMSNSSFVVKQGKVKNEFLAKARAEHAFHRYVLRDLEKSVEEEAR